MKELKGKSLLIVFPLMGTFELVLAVTTITDSNFRSAISTCLRKNAVDGLYSSSEYGAMSNWDVNAVTNMTQAFKDKTEFNANIGGWDTSKVTDMLGMFDGTHTFNQPIGSWDTSSVTEMRGLFFQASIFNQGISG